MAPLPLSMRCLSLLALFGAACNDDPTPDDVAASALVADEAATKRAYEVLSTGQVGQLRQTLAELDSVAKEHDDGYAYFYAGAFRIWSIVSSSSVPDLLALPATSRTD